MNEELAILAAVAMAVAAEEESTPPPQAIYFRPSVLPAGGGDVIAPTCVITCAQSSPTATSPLNMTFTFSEAVTGFALGDITVGNGTAGNFAGSGAVYTCDVTPIAAGNVTVDVGAGVCIDGAGNSNLAATQFVIIYLSDNFNRSNGALGGGWVGSTWAISANKAADTPTPSSIAQNGNMETGSPPTGWTAQSGGTMSAEADERTGGSGAQSLGTIRGTGSVASLNTTSPAPTTYRWYKVSYYGKGLGGVSKNTALVFNNSLTVTGTNDTIWTLHSKIGRAGSTDANVYLYNYDTGGGKTLYDDVVVSELTTASIFATVDFGVYNVTVEAKATLVAGTQAGVVMNLNNTSSPEFFVIAYHDGTNAILEKCVSGTYTTLISTAVGYVAGAVVKIVKSGTTYQLFYNGIQRGTDKTISDAGIISNTKHGIFSTDSANSLDDFLVTVNP